VLFDGLHYQCILLQLIIPHNNNNSNNIILQLRLFKRAHASILTEKRRGRHILFSEMVRLKLTPHTETDAAKRTEATPAPAAAAAAAVPEVPAAPEDVQIDIEGDAVEDSVPEAAAAAKPLMKGGKSGSAEKSAKPRHGGKTIVHMKTPMIHGGKRHPSAVPLASAENIKKRHRFHPGTRALMEIRRLQKTTEHILPRASFNRVVREIAQEYGVRFTKTALESLQCATEDKLVDLMHESYRCAIHAKRVTLQNTDMKLANSLLTHGNSDNNGV